ncbi:MAG: AAA family ATPase [bacterium]|nr:AAA family ATPase [bacterium]
MKPELPAEHYAEAEQLERALFGACILSPSAIDQVAELVGPLCFHDTEGLGAAFGLLQDLHAAGKPVSDPTLLVRELRTAGLLELIGGAGFIAKAANQALAHNALWYAAQVRELWQQRELYEAYTRGALELARGKDRAAEVASRTEAAIQAAQHDAVGELQTLDDMLGDALADLAKARERGQSLGLPTGLEILDRETGGFFAGELTILAARPSIGKTALAIELAARVAEPKEGKPAKRVLMVSLEMSAEQLAHRFLNRETEIPVRRIQAADLQRGEQAELEQARSKLKELELKAYVSPRATLASIRARARLLETQGGLDLLIIDYLGLVQTDGRLSLYERTTALSRELKQLAIELNRPILCLSQLNRESAKSGGPPTLEHLRDSGAIEQDADNVWLLHRENRTATDSKLIVAKQRQGAVGTIELEFDPKRMAFDVPKIRYTEWTG